MSLSARIIGHSSKLVAGVVDGDEENALVVATRPLKTFTNELKFFQSDDYGVDINQDASAGGTPVKVHDGIDSALWTASDTVGGGKTTFNDGDHAHGGIITVADNAGIAGEAFTINATTRTEGVDWAVAGTAALTAAAIATDINDNITGFSATSLLTVVTVTAEDGYDITTFSTSDAADLPGSGLSVKVDNSPLSDVFQFDKGSDLDCTGYVALTLWIYVDKDWKAGDDIEIFGYDTDLGTPVGTTVSLQDYFPWNVFKIWHKISIPLTDLGAVAISTALDALRVKIAAVEGKSPKFYLDDVQFEETGTPIEYKIEAEKGTWFYVDKLMITYADAYAGTVVAGTMPDIPYNKFFALSALSVGMVYQRISAGKIEFSSNIKQHSDLMNFSLAQLSGYGSNGTNSWASVVIQLPAAVILKAEEEDKVSITISEDLSGLELLKISAGGFVEER